MAIIKFGAIIDTIKGKVGNSIIQGGRHNSILKVNGINRKSQTPKHGSEQIKRRNSLNIVSRTWKTLTQAQRDSWLSLIGIWQFSDKFGILWNGTKYMIYSACNLNALYLNVPFFNSAPTEKILYNPNSSLSTYSLVGVFTAQFVNPLAKGQRVAFFIALPTYESADVNHLPFIFIGSMEILDQAINSIKAFIDSVPNFNPIVGLFFYLKLSTYDITYPKTQFETIFKIEIVA